jgi:hypothetical protein
MSTTSVSDAKPPKSTPKRRALLTQLLFQLDQLSAFNAHHEFEHICRHLARKTITPNIRPATGPVSAGGDDGRDFETFTSFIRRKEACSSLFRGDGGSHHLVFACSITDKTRVKAKIRDDMKKICAREVPYIVYFFSNQNVPIAWRLELQRECNDNYQCGLEILDTQAIAEQLTDPELFWIAEEYLHIPSDLFPDPRIAPRTAYSAARERWLDRDKTPHTFADFVNVKFGLRRSTFKDDLKSDLLHWIAVMERLLTVCQNGALIRRAQYEICVATLRGLHDLRPRRIMVEEYLADWKRWTNPSELRDSSLLLSYVSTAVLRGEFEIDTGTLHRYSVAFTAFVDREISGLQGNPNRQADLLYTRVALASLPFLSGTTPSYNIDGEVPLSFRLLAVADRAPLFGLESFVDRLSIVAPLLSDHPDFDRLMRRADEVLEKRTSGFVVAEKCRDRAISLMEKGQVLAGIAELHKAKIKWFTGDTLRPTVLAMLFLAMAYRKLGLMWASKYYAFAAAFITYQTADDDLKPLFVSSLHEIAACNYESGEWVSLSELMPVVLYGHYEFANDPENWDEQKELQATIYHFIVARALSKALNGDSVNALLNAPIVRAEMPNELYTELLSPDLDLSRFETLSATQVRESVQHEFFGVPLSDTGPTRVYTWSALGIQWRVTCSNTYDTLAQVEQFVAVLQIALADLAHRDLCLLPTSVTIGIGLGSVSQAKFELLPGNDKSGMKVTLPNVGADTSVPVEHLQRDVCRIALLVLTYCSCLSDKDLSRALNGAFRDGLDSKLFIARPYSELFREFIEAEDFEARRAVRLCPPDADIYAVRVVPELAWPLTPGPGYTISKARMNIRSRYEKAAKPIARTLDRLRSRPRFQEWVAKHRAEGRKDWWILLVLMNAIINYRARLATGGTDLPAMKEFLADVLLEEEAMDAAAFPEESLFSADSEMAAKSFTLSTATTWKLQVRTQTPDFSAVEQLLNVRYGLSADDVEHIDPFAPILDVNR